MSTDTGELQKIQNCCSSSSIKISRSSSTIASDDSALPFLSLPYVRVALSLRCIRVRGVAGAGRESRTGDGGTHLEGLKSIVTRTVNSMGRKTGKLKDSQANLGGDFVREVGCDVLCRCGEHGG